MSGAASPSRPKIDVFESVRFAYGIVIDNARLAAALGWVPFVIVMFADAIQWLGDDNWLA